ncbi:hypothetical protein K2Y11_08870 [bacterium]|nr:hypothetical protein [bacterium]
MSASKENRVIITVDDQESTNFDEIVGRLQETGLKITNVLKTSGIITGSIQDEKHSQLRSLPGVKAVEPDDEMHAL